MHKNAHKKKVTLNDLSQQIVSLTTMVKNGFDSNDEVFLGIAQRFDAMDKRFETMDARFDAIESKMLTKDDALKLFAKKDDFQRLEEKVDRINDRVSSVEKGIQDLNTNVDNLASDHRVEIAGVKKRLVRLERRHQLVS